MNREELIKEFDKKLQSIRNEFIKSLDVKSEFEIEYPKDDDRIYFISNADGFVHTKPFSYEYDHSMFRRGLYFRTESEAEQCIKENILLVKLRQWAEMKNAGWKPDWTNCSNHKFIIYYDGVYDVLSTYPTSADNNLSILPAFKTRKIAEKCIDLFGDEIIEVLIRNSQI